MGRSMQKIEFWIAVVLDAVGCVVFLLYLQALSATDRDEFAENMGYWIAVLTICTTIIHLFGSVCELTGCTEFVEKWYVYLGITSILVDVVFQLLYVILHAKPEIDQLCELVEHKQTEGIVKWVETTERWESVLSLCEGVSKGLVVMMKMHAVMPCAS